MKGVVFTLLNELVEEQFGMEMWDNLIDETDPESEGIYVATDTYPDSELVNYVRVLSARLDTPAEKIIFAFGEFCLGKFSQMYPEFFEGHDLKSFLKSVHGVIHVEVKKLHPEAILPEFTYEERADNQLVMKYRSPRKLCPLAEGLITGASKHFSSTVEIAHTECMHEGSDHCRLELSIGAQSVARSA